MIINVRVTPKAKQNLIKPDGDILRVYITAAPTDGKANQAVIKLLAAHFNVAKSNIKIIRGDTSKDKVIEICGLH
jgi:uncharacterized protein (TIGR00251 family)